MKQLLCIIALCALVPIVACAPAPTPVPALPPAYRMALPTQAPAPTMAPAALSAPSPEGARGVVTTDSTVAVSNAASAERMIVYTVHLVLEVQDADKTANDIAAIAAQFKGYVAETNLARDDKGRMRGSLTIRIPAESLDAAQKQIEAAGMKVLGRNKNSNDVTDQYTDLNAQLKNAQATADELRAMLNTVRERSTKAEDILAVYNRLTEVQNTIERLKGQMNVLEKTTTYATITIELTPHEEVQVLEPDTWVPNRTAAQALRTLVQTLQGLADLTIWLILFLLPLLIVLVLPLIILALILRAILRRKRKIAPSA